MKRMKKFVSFILAMLMIMAMTMTVCAEGNGSITINNAVADQYYSVYRILDLESYNADTGAYAYKANADWKTWLESQTTYVSFDAQGYVTWVKNADAAAFAKLAQAEAESKTAAATIKAVSATVTFTDLDLGYYLVDTSMGALCSLDTTNPNVTMKEKNEAPTITKDVLEDSTESWGDINDADISQTVNYKATITVKKGAENYVMHDQMAAGLTFQGVTAVKIGDTDVAAENYEVKASDCTDKCTFEVAFDNDYIASLDAGTQIVVYYDAQLNENAVVGLPGNDNDVWLQYGDLTHPSFTPKDTTTTYTWDMGVLKYANGNEEAVLEGAKFVLLNNDKTKAAQVVNGKIAGWADLTQETDLAEYALTTDKAGKISIQGLDADTYCLREIEAPAGYNKLAEDVEVVITGADNSTETATYTTVTAKVNNNSGSELPDTGGMGTTMFYLIGGVLVVLAAVILITRKRMNGE